MDIVCPLLLVGYMMDGRMFTMSGVCYVTALMSRSPLTVVVGDGRYRLDRVLEA